MRQETTDEVVGLHVYKPRNKPEVRLVYRYVNPQSKQRKTVRHQKSFSCNRFGEDGAWERAQQMLQYINATGRLPPSSPPRDPHLETDSKVSKGDKAVSLMQSPGAYANEHRLWDGSPPNQLLPSSAALCALPVMSSYPPSSTSSISTTSMSGDEEIPVGGGGTEPSHIGWISIQPHNINDLCAQGLVTNLKTVPFVVGVPLLLPRKCFH
eukprot:Blabericola_migrator_1__2939@NODE_1846_length_3682_cov_166_922268_g534_i1_p3_GENE_NODE_1846_length_3682_cov_166_922268_g534_i1NODE_1846_length_3682_cov_166_922268_g534_i1_p3_ORF_typecomplete_len210_score22_99_NODE_1846_length_3682_cov_166_922268_g534_i116142243